MTNYDLGTARGHIKIDYDDKGSAKADASLLALQRQANKLERSFKNLDRSLNSYERNLSRHNRTISNVSRDTDRATRSFSNLNYSILHSIPSLEKFRKAAKSANDHSLLLANTLAKISRTKGAPGLRFTDVLMGGTAFGQMKKVIAAMPQWQRSLLNLAGTITAVNVAVKALPVLFKRVAGNIAIADKAVRNFSKTISAGLAIMFPRLFNSMSKTFGAGGKLFSSFAALTAARLTRVKTAIMSLITASGILQSTFFKYFGIKNISSWAPKFTNEMYGLITSFSRAVLGFAVMKNALQGISKAATIASAALLAIGIGVSAISLVSKVTMGLWDALKQVSGILLTLPGLFATVGSSIATIAVSFIGFKDAIKAAFETDPQKFVDAWMKIPPALRATTLAVRDVSPGLKSFRDAVQGEFFKGFENDIYKLYNTLLPGLQNGMVKVAGSLRVIKDRFVSFLTMPQTVKDMDYSFSLTSGTLDRLSRAVIPVLDGLKNIAIVGQEAIYDLSNSVGGLADKFADWAAASRASGAMRKWIDNAVQGIKDLTMGTVYLAQALGTIFKAFGGPGTDALDKFRDAMQKFRDATKISAETGGLKTFVEFTNKLSTRTWSLLKSLFQDIMKLVKTFGPILDEFFSAFSTTFQAMFTNLVGSITAAAGAFRAFIKVLEAIPFSGLLGSLSSLVTFLTVSKLLLKPFTKGIAALAGFFVMIGNAGSTVAYAGGAMRVLGKNTGIVKSAMSTLKAGVMSVVDALGGPWGVATAGAIAALIYWQQSVSKTNSGIKHMDDLLGDLSQSTKGFNKAFTETNGIMGKGVIEESVKQFEALKQSLDDVAASTPNVVESAVAIQTSWSNIKLMSTAGILGQLAPWREESKKSVKDMFEQHGQMRLLKEAAESLDGALLQLGLSTADVGTAIAGTDLEFKTFIDRIQAAGASNVAIGLISQQRIAFERVKESMERMGPAAIALEEGLKQIAEAGDDATEKLEGLETVLQALGLTQTTAEQNAFDLKQQIHDLVAAQDTLIDSTDAVGESYLVVDGAFNSSSENGRRLNDRFQDIARTFKAGLASGRSYADMLQEIDPALQAISGVSGISPETLKTIFEQEYVGPEAIVKIALSPENKEAFLFDMNQLLLMAQTQADDQPIRIKATDEDTLKTLREAGVKIRSYDLTTGEIVLEPISDQQITEIVTKAKNDFNSQPVQVNPELKTEKIEEDAKHVEGVIGKIFGDLGEKIKGAFSGVFSWFANLPGMAVQWGKNLINSFTSGLQSVIEGPVGVIKRMVTRISNLIPHSPAKVGPFSGTGSPYLRGKKLALDFSSGMSDASGAAVEGGATVASAAAQGLSGGSGAMGGGFATGAGLGMAQVLKDFMELSDFSKRILDVITSIADIAMSIVDLVTVNPLTGKSVFGKKYKKTVSDEELAIARADAAVAARNAPGQQPQGFGPGLVNYTPGQPLPANPSTDDIQAYFITEGRRLGLSDNEIIMGLATMKAESGFNPTISGGAQGPHGEEVVGLFQQMVGVWGTREELTNPTVAIRKFLEAYMGNPQARALAAQGLLTQAATAVQNPQVATSYAPYNAAVGAQVEDARKILQEYIASQAPGRTNLAQPAPINVGGGNRLSRATTMGGANATYDRALMQRMGISPLYTPGEYTYGGTGLPQWIYDLARQFGLQVSSSVSSSGATSLHGAGLAFDLAGKPADMERFAQYVMRNLAGQTLQLIHRGPTGRNYGIAGGANVSDTGYYTGDYGSHMNHVHWATDVAPILGAANAGAMAPELRGLTPPPQQPVTPVPRPVTPGLGGRPGGGKPVPQRPIGPAPNGMTWNYEEGKWVPVGSYNPPTTPPPQQAPVPVNDTGTQDAINDQTDNQDRQADADYQMFQRIYNEGLARGLNADEIGGAVSAAMSAGQLPGATADTIFKAATDFMTGAVQYRGQGAMTDIVPKIYGAAGVPQDFWSNMPEAMNAISYQVAQGNQHLGNIDQNTALGLQTTDQLTQAYLDQNPTIKNALDVLKNPNSPVNDQEAAANQIGEAIANMPQDTAEQRAAAEGLQSQFSTALEGAGITEINPAEQAVNMAKTIIQGVTGIAGDFFSTFDSMLKSIEAGANIGDILVRGIANTRDVENIIENFQAFIDTAGKIAQTVGDIVTTVANISSQAAGMAAAGAGGGAGGGAGAAMSGAMNAVGAVAGITGQVIQTINAVIDLGQEAYKIGTKYLGRFAVKYLGGLTGALEGDVKFLLDRTEMTLKVWSENNPFEKREFNNPFFADNPRPGGATNYISVYGGPGQDPRDTMDTAMWAIRTSGVGALGYG